MIPAPRSRRRVKVKMDTRTFIAEEGRDEAAAEVTKPGLDLRAAPGARDPGPGLEPPGHNGKLLPGDFEAGGAATCVSRRRPCEPDTPERSGGAPPAWTTAPIRTRTRAASPQQKATNSCPERVNPRGKVETDSGGISAQVEFVPGGVTKTGCASLTTLRGEKEGWMEGGMEVGMDSTRREWKRADQTVSMTNQLAVTSAPIRPAGCQSAASQTRVRVLVMSSRLTRTTTKQKSTPPKKLINE